MKTYLAQVVNIGGQQITGPLSNINSLTDLVNKMIQFLIPMAALVLLFVIIWGGFDYMMSQGVPEKVKSAQAKLTTGIIGFVLLILSYFIVKLLGVIFGLDTGIL